MTFWKREATRRQAITGAALGTLAASYPLSLRAAKPTTQEKANIQVVKDFCAAWPAHDVAKIMSYFADNCAYRPLETMETAKGREAVEKEIKRFVNNVERFEILETWARGPMLISRSKPGMAQACSSSKTEGSWSGLTTQPLRIRYKVTGHSEPARGQPIGSDGLRPPADSHG
jgi:hypothetical protein